MILVIQPEIAYVRGHKEYGHITPPDGYIFEPLEWEFDKSDSMDLIREVFESQLKQIEEF